MPKLEPGTILPTPEEDAAITAGAESDTDNPPLTDAQIAAMRPMRGRPRLEPDSRAANPIQHNSNIKR